jgi:hypothetical protein
VVAVVPFAQEEAIAINALALATIAIFIVTKLFALNAAAVEYALLAKAWGDKGQILGTSFGSETTLTVFDNRSSNNHYNECHGFPQRPHS